MSFPRKGLKADKRICAALECGTIYILPSNNPWIFLCKIARTLWINDDNTLRKI